MNEEDSICFLDHDVMSCCEYLDGLFPEIPVFDNNTNNKAHIEEWMVLDEEKMEQQQPRETYVYVLALKEGKYYIGASDIPKERIMSHFGKKSRDDGAVWTRKYEPLNVIEVIRGDAFDEDKITKRYMHSHGIDNVRGGSYIQMCLSHEQRASLEKEFMTADKVGHFVSKMKHRWLPCQRCGFPSHIEKQCYAKFDVDGYSIDPSSEEEEEEDEEHTSSLSSSC